MITIRRDQGVVEISGAPQDIVGSSYNEILPTQPSVNKKVVDSKAGMIGDSGMTCWINPMGDVYLLDGHHTFVACRLAGRDATIQIKKFGFPAGNYSSWSSVSWADFKPAKERIRGK